MTDTRTAKWWDVLPEGSILGHRTTDDFILFRTNTSDFYAVDPFTGIAHGPRSTGEAAYQAAQDR